jgi:hypothetical protein
MTVHRLTLVLLSFIVVASGGGQKTLEQLKSAAENAKGGQQAKLYAELAAQLVNVADQQFNQGDSAAGQATVRDILQDATKARDGAISTRDNRKEVEILLRQTQRSLENLKRTLAADDRPPLDEVENKLAQFRQDLLDSMFAPNHKKKEPQ